MILILSTFPNKEEAKKVGRGLLKERLIACYNLFPVESAYWWKGKITEDNELLIIAKTKGENFEEAEKFIKRRHSYDVPEIISVKVDKVSAKFLGWLKSENKNKNGK